MRNRVTLFAIISILVCSSCSRQNSAEPAKSAEGPAKPVEAPAVTPEPAGPQVAVRLNNGSSIPGSIVASSKTEMVVAGADGVEHKIPLSQVASVDYGAESPARRPASSRPRAAAPKPEGAQTEAAQSEPPKLEPAKPGTAEPAETPARSTSAPTTRTYEVPAGSEISVRTNEAIDSSTATDGQTFDAQVTRDVKDANGDLVIPRGSTANIVIRSASKGGRIRGASDLVLDLQSVTIRGKRYSIDTADVTKTGKSGVGANRRTATYTGGGAAIGAIIGAIAGGGKGAAIGAGAGAGAGALTQILTKGRTIKVPVESVLTFSLDKPLKVNAAE